MSEACSKGCFICSNTGDGPATGRNSHSSGCCGSTLCDSRGWEKQTAKWLKAEKQWKQQAAKWQQQAAKWQQQRG